MTEERQRLEFLKCCGTSCNKPQGLKQITRLSQLYKLLKSPLKTYHRDRVHLVKETGGRWRGRVIGVFVPIDMVKEILGDQTR